MIQDMSILLAAAVLVALVLAVVVQLNRTERRRRGLHLDPRTAHRLDRDAARVRADVLAHPDTLSRRPLRRRALQRAVRADWTRHA
jgi:hypothetical protein